MLLFKLLQQVKKVRGTGLDHASTCPTLPSGVHFFSRPESILPKSEMTVYIPSGVDGHEVNPASLTASSLYYLPPGTDVPPGAYDSSMMMHS